VHAWQDSLSKQPDRINAAYATAKMKINEKKTINTTSTFKKSKRTPKQFIAPMHKQHDGTNNENVSFFVCE